MIFADNFSSILISSFSLFLSLAPLICILFVNIPLQELRIMRTLINSLFSRNTSPTCFQLSGNSRKCEGLNQYLSARRQF
jgi:hypothetical protein